MNISKEEVLSIITTQPNGNIEECCFKNKFPKQYQEILNLSFPSNFKFIQKLYHYFNNDLELQLGICPICGRRCNFKKFSKGYFHHCSKECMYKDTNRYKKSIDTCLKKIWNKTSHTIGNCKK